MIDASLSASVGTGPGTFWPAGTEAEWIPVLVCNWFPDAVFQLDHDT